MTQTAPRQSDGGGPAQAEPPGSGTAARLHEVVVAAGLGEALGQVRQRVAELASQAPRPASSAARQLLPGGKAVRPLLTLLCAQAVGGHAGQALCCATASELIHNATLLHDDVIDDGRERRGRDTARVIWGNTVSVLSGDLLFVAALRAAASDGPDAALAELLDAVDQMVTGEVIQFRYRGRLDLDLATYEQIVERKTAALFRWCARAGARSGGGSAAEIEAFGRYGRHIGIAFQIRDDVLDLTADPALLGKSLGADVAQGKLTLPLLLALEVCPQLAPDLERLSGAEDRPDEAVVRRIAAAVHETGSLAAARERMHQQLQQALAALPALGRCPAVQILATVAKLVADRER